MGLLGRWWWLCIGLLVGGCLERAQRVCISDANCLTVEPTVCYEKTCLPKVCQSGIHRSCFTGPDGSRQTGTCKEGIQVCEKNGSAWSPCFGEILPRPEICDGLDNDCNGSVDDGIQCDCKPGETQPCYTGPGEPPKTTASSCRVGIQYCQQSGRWGACLLQILPHHQFKQRLVSNPKEAIQQMLACYDQDRNCDAQIDPDRKCTCKAEEQRPCYLGPLGTENQGACKSGVQRCIVNPSGQGNWGFCEKQVLPRPEEEGDCNGEDDDCDGKIDNQSGTHAPLWKRCPPEMGTCMIQICQRDKTWSVCQSREICDNQLDDNCDGKVDEPNCHARTP